MIGIDRNNSTASSVEVENIVNAHVNDGSKISSTLNELSIEMKALAEAQKIYMKSLTVMSKKLIKEIQTLSKTVSDKRIKLLENDNKSLRTMIKTLTLRHLS